MRKDLSLTALLAAASTVSAVALPAKAPVKRGPQVVSSSVLKTTAFHAETPLQVTDNHLQLVRQPQTSSKHASLLSHLQKNGGVGSYVPYTTPNTQLVSVQGYEYLVNVEWAGQNLLAILDTGSSDTWLVQQGFKCVDANGKPQPEAECNFGPTFNGTFNHGTVKNQNFNISYGDGEYLNGLIGREDITIAGLTVKEQESALGNYAYWNGDGISSGLVGFAYPSLTSAFPGNNPVNDNFSNHDAYDPWFTSAYKQGLTKPMFSLALQRGENPGYIAFGGLPPVNHTDSWTPTPIVLTHVEGFTAKSFDFYTINVDGYHYGTGITNGSQAIVDSGTTLLYLPGDVAKNANEAFRPRAKQLDSEGGLWFVDCKAKAPPFTVQINGAQYPINAADLIFQDSVDNSTGLCLTGIQDGGAGPYILGDVFLQNVIAIFDVGAAKMKFTRHIY